jgi:hypothetical protein
MKLDLKPAGLTFSGYSDTKKTTYHLELEFYDEIDVEESKPHRKGCGARFEEEGGQEYWPDY